MKWNGGKNTEGVHKKEKSKLTRGRKTRREK